MGFKQIVARLLPLISPIAMWMYRKNQGKIHRRGVIRIGLVFMITPIIGYFRRPHIKQLLKEQLSNQIQIQQDQMKQSLQKLQININDNNFQYMIVVRSTQKNLNDDALYDKQKKIFQLNSQILQKVKNNQNYFQGIKFLFLGDQKVYQAVKNNFKQQQNQFDYLNNQQKNAPMMMKKQQDKIFLMTRQDNGQQKIIMEWDLNTNLKAIMRQVAKHKHKKYVQSMNF